MTAATALPPGERNLLLRGAPGSEPPVLDMFVKVREPGDFHFYARHVTAADFVRTFEGEIRPLDGLVYRIPAELLNPNYWEPMTREGEAAVREKLSGIITRIDGDKTFLWRADGIAPGRLLRDGLDVPVELVHGYVFRTSGEGLIQLSRAWAGGRDRFEWIGFQELPDGAQARETVLAGHGDLTAFKFRQPGGRLMFSSTDDRMVRVLFSDRAALRKAVSSMIRGFSAAVSHQPSAPVNDRTADQMIRLCDGFGFTADPRRHVTDKHRTFEINARLGRTEWGLHLRPGQESLLGDEKVLLYYDRISGIWAVAS